MSFVLVQISEHQFKNLPTKHVLWAYNKKPMKFSPFSKFNFNNVSHDSWKSYNSDGIENNLNNIGGKLANSNDKT